MKYRPPGRYLKHRPPFGASSYAARRSAAAFRASVLLFLESARSLAPLHLGAAGGGVGGDHDATRAAPGRGSPAGRHGAQNYLS